MEQLSPPHAGYEGGVPTTPLGKLISIGIACIGLPIFLLYICLVGGAMSLRLQAAYSRCCCSRPPAPAPVDSRGSPDSYSHWKVPPPPDVKATPPWLLLVILLLYLGLGSAWVSSYHAVHPVDALHYCFSLLATIGVTRLPLHTEVREEDMLSVLFTSLYILVGMALVSMCLHSLQGGISSLVTSLRSSPGSTS